MSLFRDRRGTTGAAALAALAVLVAPTLAACGERDDARDEVLRAVRRTSSLANRFEYVDSRPPNPVTGAGATRITVRGIVEDDFRYKARAAYDGAAGFEEVVNDDVLAVRFLDPRRLPPLVNKQKAAEADLDTDVDGLNLVQALETRRWVVDPSGAPSRTAGAPPESELGSDPVLDAITAMSYVERAVRQAQAVQQWSEDDLSPAYSESEDDFPKPESGSAVRRFDLYRPPLPQPGNLAGRSESNVPTTRHFRRMAIYVKAGRVIQVSEAIDLRGRYLDDFMKYTRTFLREADASEEAIADFDAQRRQLADASDDERAVAGSEILHGFSANVEQLGVDPILIRRMRLELRDLGGKARVDLPVTDLVRGRLGILRITDEGKQAEEEESETAPAGTGGTGGTASTTP